MVDKIITQQIQILLNQFNAKNYDHVITKGNSLLKKNPQYVILYNLIGSSYQNIGNYLKAKNTFLGGLKLDPGNISLMNNLAMSYKNLLEYSLAEELYLKIINTNSKYLNAYVNLGNLKRDLNQFNEAIKLYERALSISDNNPIIFYSLALANQGIGAFDKTIFYSQKALVLDPNFTRADHLISQSSKYRTANTHYSNLKNKLKNKKKADLEKVDLYFCLAKAEEDLGNFKESSNFLIKGNKLKKELLNYSVNEDLNLNKQIEKKFEKLNINDSQKDLDEKVIFILGMPRSGTSLVEQIITSHSKVFGGGELPILSNLIKNNFIQDNFLADDLFKTIQDPLTINKLKTEYLRYIDNFKFTEKYITDKSPLNLRWIGFIKIIFPGAKIILCSRDPKENCLSMYKNLFEGGLNFTYDQEDLVKYYKSCSQLMDFWKTKLANSIFEVKYEDLISNNDAEIKKIINFCGLNWEDNCLNFHKNKTPIKTMSTAQARQPIYKSSLKNFNKFKEYLKILDNSL